MSATETLAGLTAAPDFVTVNGRKITLHPLTMADIGVWNRWARAEFLVPALTAAGYLEDLARLEAQRAALNEAKQIGFYEVAAIPIMHSTEGMLKTLELSLAHSKEPPAADMLAVWFKDESGVLSQRALLNAVHVIYHLSGFLSAKRLLEYLGLVKSSDADEKKTETETPKT
ncbi:MAG: hypothetical protein ABSA16_18275 [Thermoguttaceae bacterium]|jgi:hypothetical protein